MKLTRANKRTDTVTITMGRNEAVCTLLAYVIHLEASEFPRMRGSMAVQVQEEIRELHAIIDTLRNADHLA